MASGNSFAALSRASRKGVSGTSGRPEVMGLSQAGVIGAMPSPAVAASTASLASVPAEDRQHEVLVDLAESDAVHELPARAIHHSGRSASSPFEKLIRGSSSMPEQSEEPRAYVPDTAAAKASPFSGLVRPDAKPVANLARRDMSAAKVLTRLVMAIVRKPGSGVPDGVKSKALTSLLCATRDAASRLTSSIAPLDAHRGWVQASALEAAATMVATRWENDPDAEPQPLTEQIEILEGVFRVAEGDVGLRAALDELGVARYVEATDSTVAAARVDMSARMALWDLLGWINHPSLGASGVRYTYDRPATEIVELLAPELMNIAREGNIRIDNLDLRTSHMQSSLRRLADLMGSEYVARTRVLMNWIAEEGISEAVHQERRTQASSQFQTRVLPDLIDWARRNFMAIESMAARFSEESDERLERNHPRQ